MLVRLYQGMHARAWTFTISDFEMFACVREHEDVAVRSADGLFER